MNELQITVGRIVLDGVEYEIGGTTVELDEEMAEYIRETLAEHGVEHNPENTV
jgi:predicted O-methyltransferase YrrM